MIAEFKNNQEAQILWSHLNTTFTITAVVPLFYEGTIAGSEFLTYAATKLYLCLECTLGAGGGGGTTGERVDFYNAANAVFFLSRLLLPCFHTGTLVMWGIVSDVTIKNFYFSRLLSSGQYLYLLFKGYRLTRT